MARIRTIKPEFFLDDDVARLNPLTRILFIGLWCLADRDGRLEDRSTRIKVQILPYDKYDIDAELEILAKSGFIVRYTVEGCKYIEIPSFSKHQAIHGTERESIIPCFTGEITVNNLLDNSGGAYASNQNSVGRERKGKEGKDLYGESVKLSKMEFNKLALKYGQPNTEKAIAILDQYVMSTGKKYKSHYHTILNGWPIERAMSGGQPARQNIFTRASVPKVESINCPGCQARMLKTDLYNGKCHICNRKESNGTSPSAQPGC